MDEQNINDEGVLTQLQLFCMTYADDLRHIIHDCTNVFMRKFGVKDDEVFKRLRRSESCNGNSFISIDGKPILKILSGRSVMFLG